MHDTQSADVSAIEERMSGGYFYRADQRALLAEVKRLREIEERARYEKASHGDADPAHEVERQVWECMHYVLTGEDLDA